MCPSSADPPAVVYLDGLTAAQGIVLTLNGEQERDNGRLALDARFIVRQDILAGNDIELLGDERTELQIDALVQSGGGAQGQASVMIDASGHITASGATTRLDGGSVFVSVPPSGATGGTAGTIVITGAPSTVLSGTGTLRSSASGIDHVTIVNDSNLALVLGEIFATGEAASAPISVNGVAYVGINTVINGVHIESLAGDGPIGSGGISVTSHGGGDVLLADRVSTVSGSIAIDVLGGSLLSASPTHLLQAYGVTLVVPAGAIGTDAAEINLALGDGLLFASARDGIALDVVGGSVRLGKISSPGSSVSLRAAGSILDGDGADGADVIGARVRLIAGADGGSLVVPLLVDVPTAGGAIDAAIGGDLYLKDPTDDLRIGLIEVGGRAELTAARSVVDVLGGDGVNVIAGDLALTALNGVIGTLANRFTVDAEDELSLTATTAYVTELGGNNGGGHVRSTGGIADLLVLGGDLNLDDITADWVVLELDRGSAAIGRLQTVRLDALVRAEGGGFQVDDFALTGRRKTLATVLADNTVMSVSDDRQRAKGIVFDLRGNDGRIAERVELTGVARSGARFNKLYADTAAIDLGVRATDRANKLQFKDLKLTSGGSVANSINRVVIDPLQDRTLKLILKGGRVRVRPGALQPLVHVTSRTPEDL